MNRGRKHTQILITEPEYFTEASINLFKKIGNVEIARLTRQQLLNAAPLINALVVRIETAIDKEFIEKAKNLKCVATATTGLDHIDIQTFSKRGIPLFSLHGTHSISTAEHTLALLLGVARRIPWAHNATSGGSWERWKYKGMELSGKTLGIFGIGRIGTKLASRGGGIDMKVIAYDPYLSSTDIKRRGAKKVGWLEFLKRSDVISIHAPLTKETRWRFDEDAFYLMKPNTILINTARGLVVKEKALLRALEKHRIFGAALDVYPEEPLPPKHSLRQYARRENNLLLTPHIGATTEDAIQKASIETAMNVAKFFGVKIIK